MKRLVGAAGTLVLAAGLAACGSAHSAPAQHVPFYTGPIGAGMPCVIPGTRVTVPSLEGARFGGEPHSCVDGVWEPFSAARNLT